MEEQPGQQQHHHHHHHVQHSQSAHSHYYYYSHTQHPSATNVQHGAEGSAKYQPKPLKHDHKHALQHQETHQKKTDNGELNGSLGERHLPPKILVSGKPASQAASGVPNGSQQVADTNTKQLPKAHNFGKAGSKPKTLLHKNSMDKKNEKSYESKVKESKSPDKGEAGYIQNGVLSNSAGYITNGYVNKNAENDGSGSENGYATPKKRKARCSVSKAVEEPNIVIDKTMDIDGKLESDSLVDQKGGARVDNAKASWKCEAAGAVRAKPSSGDIQRKNSDAKPVTAKKFDDRPKGKTSTAVSSKEDSWTLFKPPPVFPVDNSSAKIVPKISYASKVKENLNKAAQNNSASQSSLAFTPQAGDIQPLNCVSQVPMSAMKSVSTVNFANGPLLVGTDGGFLATAASTVPHSLPGGAEPLLAESASVPNFSEQKKTGLFTYPSNMQHALPDTIQRDMSGQSNQHSLGEIFQNQWGLSFINEPSAGPEAGSDKPAHGQVVWEPPNQLVSQGADVAASGNERPVFPKAYELEKRTSAQVPDGVPLKAAHGSGAEGTVLSSDPKDYGELQNTDSASQGTLVFQSKVFEIDVPQTSLKNTLQTSAKDKRFHGGLDSKDSWSSFDLRAAILYHTKEMESILSLQKQDPSRIITYNEAMDLPDH
ncbi:FMR1-interacting protein NUFIP2 isoform X2 [Spea bombifrons]|uniref:FMR1-interacting protein NUFIP2 isoform X2 n=1 Tax=Spea bombifrons TaxID=233779 RepID=UPI00234AE111|nr:FMR1-interacting protein NUFIP2 isoform X2 [Spea bombifrons]